MKSSKILALALFGACATPAAAASITYDVSIPLIADGTGDTVATDTLTGQLSYDADTLSGIGTFTIASLTGDTLVSSAFSSPFTFILDAGDGSLGVFFDGTQGDGYELYFNINTATTADTLSLDNVSYAQTSGTTFYTSIGGSVTPAATSTVSPVPLPPAVSLFGGALLAVGGIGAARRGAPRLRLALRR